MKKALRFVACWWVSLCVLWAPVAAYAQQGVSAAQIVRLSDGSARVISSVHSWLKDVPSMTGLAANVSGGKVNLTQAFKGPVGTLAEVGMNATRAIPFAGVAKAVAKSLPLVSAVSIAAGLFDSVRCRPDGSGIMCDNGTPPVATSMWRVPKYPSGYDYGTTPLAAYMLYLESQRAAHVAGWGVNALGSGVDSGAASCSSTPNCTGGKTWVRRATGPGTNVVEWYNEAVSPVAASQNICPAYIRDAVNHPAGEPPGADGKCRTGTEVATTADTAGTRVAAIPGFESQVIPLLQGVSGKGIDFEPYLEPTSLSGPASVNGPSKTTTRTPAGGGTPETITEQTRYDITYAGDTYNYTTNTTTINNTTGETTTETKEDDVAPPSDPSMPPQPDLYDQKYPDGLAGVWNNASAALQSTPIFTFLASLVPSVGDGGCPTWSMPVMTGWKQFSTADISVPCWVWSAVRGIVVCTALLSCRKIIFGG